MPSPPRPEPAAPMNMGVIGQEFSGPSKTQGSNHLQSSLDRLTKAVEDLRSTIGAGSGANGGFGAGNANGPSSHAGGGGGAGFGGMIQGQFSKFTGRSPAQTSSLFGGVGAVAASFGSYGQGQMAGQVQMSSFVPRQ